MITTQQVDIIARSDHNWQSIEDDEPNRPPAKSKRRHKPGRSGARALPTSDRLLSFAKAIRKQIDGTMFTCEEFYPQSGSQAVLYVVLERGAAQWRDKLHALHKEYFGSGLSDL